MMAREIEDVAPRAGAWIETNLVTRLDMMRDVAPRAGAWIETTIVCHHPARRKKSRPVRARGLKHIKRLRKELAERSRPVRARGLKRTYESLNWKCQRVAPRAGAWIETMTVWDVKSVINVAPRAGAWIETRGRLL
ncbi:TPA: hypothetical protein JMF69_001659 [Legionella pneumophila]|nr:hypothetical protein [Legionella pneumophila]HAW6263966.1 hypothetical protein [Legionella pneumophila]